MGRIFIIFFLLSLELGASSQSLKDTVRIVQVEITSKKRNFEKGVNKTDIDSLVLSKNMNSNLSDVLIKHTPIFVKNYGPGELATASFRGTAASHTQVEWNGITLNSPMLGQVDLSLLPVFFIDDISLFYGSSSLVRNSGALGGLVSIDNKPDWNNLLKTTIAQSIGSFNNYQSYASFGTGTSTFQSNTRFFHELAMNNFSYQGDNAIKKQVNASYQKYGFMQEFYSRLKNNQFLDLKVWGMKTDRNLPPLKDPGTVFDQNQKDYSLNTVADYKYLTSKGSWQLTSAVSLTKMSYYFSEDPINSLGRTSSFINKLLYKREMDSQLGIETGIDFNYSKVNNIENKDTSTIGYIKNRSEWSGFGRMSLKINEKLNLFFLIRQGLVNGELIPFIPSLSSEYQIIGSDKLILRASVARNYHIPSLNDLYYAPGGNPKLKPEKGYSSDLGIEIKQTHQQITYQSRLTCFASLIDNWITWSPPDSSALIWTASNIKKVFSRGIEFFLSIDANANKWTYHLRANYSYTKTTNQDEASKQDQGNDSYGKQLIYIPFHVYNVLAQIERNNYHASISANYTGNRFTSSNNSPGDVIPRSLLNDLEIGKVFSLRNCTVDMQFRIDNIFDVQYEVILNRAMPGRNYNLVAKINFKK